jgi:hypothetical protein
MDGRVSSTSRTIRARISSLACFLPFLTVVAVAAWIIISSGAGHAMWQ